MTIPSPAQSSSLANKTAIITGSSRGLGAAMALGLASRGARVLITYTSTSSTAKAEELVHQINLLGEKTGARAAAVRADLRQVESMERVVTAALALDAADREGAWLTGVDIVVNNAAGSLNKGLDQVTGEDYASIYDLNVRAPLLLTQALLPHLRRPGRIINIGSVAGRCGMKMLGLYCSSKAALEGMCSRFAARVLAVAVLIRYANVQRQASRAAGQLS